MKIYLLYIITLFNINHNNNNYNTDAIITQALKVYNNEILSEPFMMEAYYYEYAKDQNRKLLQFTEAQGVLISRGYNYSIQLQPTVFIPVGLRKSERDSTWLSFRSDYAAYFEEKFISDLPMSQSVVMNSFRRFEINYLLNEKKLQKELEIKHHSSLNDDQIVIELISKNKNRKYPLKVIMCINKYTYQIVQIELENVPFYLWSVEGLVPVVMKINYSDYGDKRFISNIEVTLSRKEYLKRMKLITSDKYKLIQIEEYPDENLVSLMSNPMVNYDYNKWRHQYSPDLSVIFESDINKEDIEKQFMKESGRPFSYTIKNDDTIVDRSSIYKQNSRHFLIYQKIKAFYEQ